MNRSSTWSVKIKFEIRNPNLLCDFRRIPLIITGFGLFFCLIGINQGLNSLFHLIPIISFSLLLFKRIIVIFRTTNILQKNTISNVDYISGKFAYTCIWTYNTVRDVIKRQFCMTKKGNFSHPHQIFRPPKTKNLVNNINSSGCRVLNLLIRFFFTVIFQKLCKI